jgi:hypothetical protein
MKLPDVPGISSLSGQLRSVNRRIAVIVALAVVLVCGVLLYVTHAATSSAAAETESGSLSGKSAIINDASASGGSAVIFSAQPKLQTLHYTANIGTDQATAASLGFNLFDIGPTKASIDALPNGVRAVVWVGNLDNAPIGSACPAPGLTFAQFQAVVDNLKNDPKVFAYYLSDEPHPAVCPNAASDIMARADYIHANAPNQKSFIVVLDGSNVCSGTLGCEYDALKPANTHVDYIGLDPYPCHYAADGVTAVPCDISAITSKVQLAISKGIPASSIVPTFQTFGQAGRIDGKTIYYRMPTTTEMTDMFTAWHSLVPNPAFDYAYSFGVQCTSTSCPASQAVINHPEIQTLVQQHNGQ